MSLDVVSQSGSRANVDFKTGASLNASSLINSNVTALAAGLLGFQSEMAKYPSIFSSWKNLTSPINEDLLLPFGDFLAKYNLEGAAFTAFSFAQGAGNILAQPTLYVMKYLNPLTVTSIISNSFVGNGLSNNQELYNRALAELAETAFLSSHVHNIVRDDTGVEVHMYTPTGPKLIKARKLLITIPPKYEHLSPILDLDLTERSIFRQFNNSYYWDMILKNTGLPTNLSLSNLDPAAPFQLPALPALYNINAVPSIPGLHTAYYGSTTPLTESQVKSEILTTLDRIRAGLGYPPSFQEVEFVGFNRHAPFLLTAPGDAIREGFYSKLLALQGQRNTWYTGAAFLTQASGPLWEYTEAEVLPDLVKSLGLSGLRPLSGRDSSVVEPGGMSDTFPEIAADEKEKSGAPEYGNLQRARDFVMKFPKWL